MAVERKTKQRITYVLGMVCASVLLFWTLPIVVWKNYADIAERLSILPGISPNGGRTSGLLAGLYLAVALIIIAASIVILIGPTG